MRYLLPVAGILLLVAPVFGQSAESPVQGIPDKGVVEQKDPPIRKIFFESQLTGFGGLSEDELAAGLPGFQASLRGEFKGDYDEEALERDCRKLREFLLAKGFPKVSVRLVTTVAVGDETRAVVRVDVLRRTVVGKFKSVGFNSVSGEEVATALSSETGRPILLVEWSHPIDDSDDLAASESEGDEQAEDEADEAERQEQSSKAFLRSDLDAAGFSDVQLSRKVEEIVASAYRKIGQKTAKILARPVFTGETDANGREIIDFIVGVDEDPRLGAYAVRRIEFDGNKTTLDRRLRRRISLWPGESFSPILLELSLESIRQFKHLANVHVSNFEFDEENKRVDITISMTEISPDPFSEGLPAISIGIGFEP